MASITLSPDPQRFPEGVTISAYKTSNWSGAGIDTAPNGQAPQGSADASAAIASRTLTLTGLTVDQDYWAVYNAGGGDYRYFRFGTWQSSSTVRSRDAVLRSRSAINVQDEPYGALADGTHDDAAAINAAILAAKIAGAKEVLMPPGVYGISSAIRMYDGIKLVGSGVNWKDTTKGTVIKTTGTGVLAGLPMINVSDTLWAGIENLALVGPTTDATANTTVGISDFADTSKQAGFLRIKDVAFRYLGGTCIALYGNVNWIQNFRADDCAGHKIHLKNSGDLGTGSDNHIEGVDTGYCTANGTGSGSAGDGLFIEGGSNNEIIGGRFYNQRYGIHILNGSGNRFAEPRCEKNDKAGIFLDTTTKNIFTGIDQFNNGLTSGAGNASVQLSASTRNRISGSVKNYQYAAIPGVQTFTGDTHGTTTIDSIASTANLRVGQKLVGTDIAASTYIDTVNANSIVISIAATGTHTGVTLAPLPTDKGVILQGASDHNTIDVDVDSVNVHGVQIDESAYNAVMLTCYDAGQSAYVVGGAAGTKDWNLLARLVAKDCGQRTASTYDVISVTAGTNNWINDAEYIGLATKKARDFIRLSGGTGTYITDAQAASSQVAGSTLTDSGASTQVRNFRGYVNSAPSVSVPASAAPIAAANANRWFYITGNAAGSTSVAVQNGPTIVVAASATVPVFVPAGQTFTPTYTNAPTWVVHQVGT